ncbi:uncharacterized protein MELLADRAFT_86042 [Melampsora larici-populina 98AG31]|uniref:Uncharacterized protein n=1 Tax=Melampsora larici-populina (strain 98AG31 / pathotype 3-4-7) TaxID=747676 RepID=F4RKJ6_MELLP|nr:uncharacterized protein MELLADRAFT_86042 [Melampsora larici-populina 98AG31]EGG07168.1 hypothetical protein MELLADRAFT_86042 [Melampsora larici-populina 98AG31]
MAQAKQACKAYKNPNIHPSFNLCIFHHKYLVSHRLVTTISHLLKQLHFQHRFANLIMDPPPDLQLMLQETTKQLAAQNKLIQDIQAQSAQMQAESAARDESYEKLLKKFKDVSVQQSASAEKGKSRASTSSKAPTTPISHNRPSLSLSSRKTNPTPAECFEPSQSSRRSSAPPKPSPKRHPIQMAPDEAPPGFQGTRINALAEDAAARDLLPITDIVSLRDAKSGRIKVGKGIIHLQDFFLRYSVAMLAKLGICCWAPDLEDAPDSMWNEACRISAIKILRMWITGKVFPNADAKFVHNLLLLERTYNHYVHYYMAKKYQKEAKESGANQREEARKTSQRGRQRLRDTRFAYAGAKGFPTRYLSMLQHVEAHSDDEFDVERQVYVVKTPIYQSVEAGIFMRRVDEHMRLSKTLSKTRIQTRTRIRPKHPIESTLTRPPRGLPIDFYNAEWYNVLPVADRQDIADAWKVMFLPDPSESLLGRPHPDEKLEDQKFTDKHWRRATKDYDLDHEFTHATDSDVDSEDEDDGKFAKDSIDLANTDGEEDEEEGPIEEDDFEEDPNDFKKGGNRGALSRAQKLKGRMEADEDESDWDGEVEEGETGKGAGNGEGGSRGRGQYYVDDDDMEEKEDDARARRWDIWNNA